MRHLPSIVVLTISVALAGCVPISHLARQYRQMPVFDPIVFFVGRTQGRGSLKIAMRGRQSTIVEGRGVAEGVDSIVLDQVVRSGDAPPTRRRWWLRRIAPGRYSGTLSDAAGPVTGDVLGNRLHLAFAMKGGLRAQQWLYLQPGGQVAHNRMIVTKFGIPVASLDETIDRRP